MSARKRRGRNRPSTQDTQTQSKKERREVIRQARIETQRQRMRARRRRRFMTWGLVGLVAVLGTGFGIFRYIDSRRTSETRAKQAGCSEIEQFPDEGRTHLQQGETQEYETNPPTSGPHHPAPVEWGAYPDSVEPERLVHNLEHGGTVIHYRPGDLSEDEIIELEDFVNEEFPGGAVVNPNPDIPKPIALAAWRYIRTCEKISLPVIESFIKARCNKGPEPAAECGRLGGP